MTKDVYVMNDETYARLKNDIDSGICIIVDECSDVSVDDLHELLSKARQDRREERIKLIQQDSKE